MLDDLTTAVGEIRVNLCEEIISNIAESRNETMKTFTMLDALRDGVEENSSDLKQMCNNFLAFKDSFHDLFENWEEKQPRIGQKSLRPNIFFDNRAQLVGEELPVSAKLVIKTKTPSRLRIDPPDFLQRKLSARLDEESDLNTDIQARILEHTYRRTLKQYSWLFGTSKESLTTKVIKPHVHTAIKLTLKHNIRNTHVIIIIAFRLIHQHVLHFELRVRQRIRHWLSIPWLGCSLAVVNVRESDAPIFQACFDWDLETVRFLLESGRAGLHDVDTETRCGLLEHVFRVNERNTPRSLYRPRAKFRGQLVLQYLLDQGYNPNIFHGLDSIPAPLMAFMSCFASSVSLLFHHGTELDSFEINPTSLLAPVNSSGYRWQLRLLRSLGFSDWKVDDNCHSLLHSAAENSDFEEALFSLEIAHQNPNTRDGVGRTPLVHAAETGRIAMQSILVESGAQVNAAAWTWNGPPLNIAVQGGNFDMAHSLLFNGADPTLQSSHSENSWYIFWENMLLPSWPYRESFDFIILEGLLAHLLLHHADPFQPAEHRHYKEICEPWECNLSNPWYCSFAQIQSLEFARAWSFISERLVTSRRTPTDEERLAYEDAETNRVPTRSISWSPTGIINGWEPIVRTRCGAGYINTPSLKQYRDDGVDKYRGEATENMDEDLERTSEDHEQSLDENDGSTCDRDDNSDDSGYTKHPIWQDLDEYFAENDDTYRGGGIRWSQANIRSFERTTLFYQTISTQEGRYQMATFPAVRMLCNALLLAGYRAEMGKEGDIWFEDDDGDMYYDAREHQTAEDLDNEHISLCPICKDPEKYGLGHIIRESEFGKERLFQYKEKVRRQKRTYF